MIQTDYAGLTKAILTDLLRLKREGYPVAVAHIELTKFAVVNVLAAMGPGEALEMLRCLEAQIEAEFPHEAAHASFPPTQGNA